MPKAKKDLPKLSEDPQFSQFKFNGAWYPDLDPAFIGPESFRTLENMRYIGPAKATTIEGVPGYSKINTVALANTLVTQGIQLRSNRTTPSIVVVHAKDGTGQGKVYENRTAIPDAGAFETTPLHTDAALDLIPRFAEIAQNSIAYNNGRETMIYSGPRSRAAAVWKVNTVSGTYVFSDIEDVTAIANNALSDSPAGGYGNTFVLGQHNVIWSTRPLKGVYFDIKTASTASDVLVVYYHKKDGSFATMTVTDGTAVGGFSMKQDGLVGLSDERANEAPYYSNGLYLYCYYFVLGATADAEVVQVELDIPWQNVVDVWDGVYRQPMAAQFYKVDHYEDYTLHVNESSTLDFPVGMLLGGLVALSDHVIIGFEQPQAAIRMQFLAGKVNTAASVITGQYWKGTDWETMATMTNSPQDGTDNSGKSMGQTGVVSWTPPPDESGKPAEKKQELFGLKGYFYKFTWSVNFAPTTNPDDIVVDVITGIPRQHWDTNTFEVPGFRFAHEFKGRVMQVNYADGYEFNRIDFSETNAPDVYNGEETSMGGVQSIYVGKNEDLMAGGELYNRYGSRIFTLDVLCKRNETWVLDGSGPEDFTLFRVSGTVGCPCAASFVTAEVGFDVSSDVQRQMAMWVSATGPVMFDGALLKPIDGIDTFFDRDSLEHINFDSLDTVECNFNTDKQEWNILIPLGTETVPNCWLTFDLIRKKWFRRRIPDGKWWPTCTVPVRDALGNPFFYAGTNAGFMLRLEHGTSYDGSEIPQVVEPGDFWPSNNIWHQTRIRRFKIVAKRINEQSNLQIFHYPDTSDSFGSDMIFTDTDMTFIREFNAANGVEMICEGAADISLDLSIGVGAEATRIARATSSFNRVAWSHGFSFRAFTAQTVKGFQPIAWGIEWQYVRIDK